MFLFPGSRAQRKRIINSAFVAPQGRLSLTSATPVMTSTVSGATTIYYTPYMGACVPLYDGTNFNTVVFSELSNVTSNTAVGMAGPAAVGVQGAYDLFVWSWGGKLFLSRGPAWSSPTARSAGTALTLTKGIWLNTTNITNGPPALRGTYVGTVFSNGSSQVDYIFGALAAGGTAAQFCVWNMYNRVSVTTFVADNTNSWVYSTNTWRSANASATMRVTFFNGISEDGASARYNALVQPANAGLAAIGVGVDSTTAFTGTTGYVDNAEGILAGTIGNAVTAEAQYLGLGFHYFQAIEISAVGTTTFIGDSGGTTLQSGLTATIRA